MIELMPDGTILYQWVMFIAAVLILNFGIFRPTLKLIAARRAATEGDEAKAEELEGKIEELSSRIEAQLEQARQEGQDIIHHLRQEAEASSNQSLQTARNKADSFIQGARSSIEQQSKEVEMQLRQHAQTLADEVAGRVLSKANH